MDDFSRYCTAIPLKNKVGSEVATALMKFIEQLETMTKQKVSQIQADWGGEFRNKDTQQACESKGIILKETIPHHSETNTAIERAIRTITTIAITTLIASGLPKNLWADAMKFASYTKNRIPHKALGGKSPLEILQPVTDIIAERSNLQKFGEEAIVYNYGVTDKMAARSHRGYIIGYTNTYGVYQTNKNQKRMLAKNPKPIQDNKTKDLEIPGVKGQPKENPDLEPAIRESPAEITSQVEPIAISTPTNQKHHRKTPKNLLHYMDLENLLELSGQHIK
jgi:transposase InsO family protein